MITMLLVHNIVILYTCPPPRKGAMLGFSTMGVTFIMGGYLMLGAVIFSGLEGGHILISSYYIGHDH